jgi:hypothetical protein
LNFRSVGNHTADAEFAAQIMDPSGQEAGLDDDRGRLHIIEQLAQFGPRRVEGREADLAGGLIMGTSDGLVFAEVDGQNGGRGRGVHNRVHRASSVGVTRLCGNCLRYHVPRLAWILSATGQAPSFGETIDATSRLSSCLDLSFPINVPVLRGRAERANDTQALELGHLHRFHSRRKNADIERQQIDQIMGGFIG